MYLNNELSSKLKAAAAPFLVFIEELELEVSDVLEEVLEEVSRDSDLVAVLDSDAAERLESKVLV